jgi:branched-chain amino acid transport system permease protein
MSLFLQLTVAALIVSCLYALVAVGFTMYVGVINLANFSHGDACVMGAFILMPLFILASSLGWLGAAGTLVLVLLFLVVSALTGVWGGVIYRLLVRPLLGAPRLILLLATVAAGQVIREIIRVVYPNGSNPQVFPKMLPEGGLSLAGLDVGYDAISIVLITIGVILGLNFVILRTRMGMAMRAVSQNADVAQMMGVNMDRTVTIVFVLGSALAGLAGLLNGSYYGITKFSIGSSLGIKGFSAAVIGGLGDFYGAIMGGVLLGFVEVFSAAYIPEGSQYQDVFSFLAVILFLLFRPRGILGERTYEKV